MRLENEKMINKDTRLCISVASKPSNFGTTVHNAGYKALKLNYLYKAFRVNDDIENIIQSIRTLDIRGCSVSMPFKESVLPYLDNLDESVVKIGAANTILNDGGKLIGFNTDAIGAKIVINALKLTKDTKILLAGAGGVSRAILFALSELGFRNISATSRDTKSLEKLISISNFQIISWSDKETEDRDLIINATPIGMKPNQDESIFSEKFIIRSSAIMDVVVSDNDTKLIKLAKKNGKQVIPGWLMSLEQAIEQFKIYTGVNPPRVVLEEALKEVI